MTTTTTTTQQQQQQRALITSFDGCGVWRNPYNTAWDGASAGPFTDGEWYHLDQNARSDPGFLGYQGLVNLLPSTALTGSTVVVPRSHGEFRANCERGGKRLDRGSFVPMHRTEANRAYCAARAVQVAPLRPGDVLVWDARLVHCSAGVAKNLPETHALRALRPPLARLVAYVAMMPRARVSNHASVAAKRRAAVERGTGTGWNPLVMRSSAGTRAISRSYRAPPATDPLWTLV